MRTLLSSLPFFLCMKYAFSLLLLWNFFLSSGFKYLNMMCLLVLSSCFLRLGFIEVLESMDLQFSSFLEKNLLLFFNYISAPQHFFSDSKNTYILGPSKLAYSSQILCSFSYLFPHSYLFHISNKMTVWFFRWLSVAEMDPLSLKSQIHWSQALKETCVTLEFVVLFTALQIKLPASITL